MQDAAAVPLDRGRMLLLGGLTASDVSTDAVLVAGHGGSHQVARLPDAVHDSAAVRLGTDAYLFGGGTNRGTQSDSIVRVDPRVGTATTVGRLPAPSSDQAAASLNGVAYIVGGYTGSRWLNTIVAWSPGTRARVVAHLPRALRYAAVAGTQGRLVIVGGSLPTGEASASVFVYRPGHGVVRAGRLPAPVTHAAAAALGGLVVRGRGSRRCTPEHARGDLRRRSGRATRPPRGCPRIAAFGSRRRSAGWAHFRRRRPWCRWDRVSGHRARAGDGEEPRRQRTRTRAPART